MYQLRVLSALIFTCIAFVGIAAALKASDLTQTHVMVADASTSAADHQQAPRIDESFFATTTAQTQTGSSTELAQSAALALAVAPAAPIDPVTASAYVVGDIMTGKIYLEKKGKEVLPFASMSKLITAIASTDKYKPDDVITITASSTEVPPDASNLQTGERFTAHELLYPMLMDSSNVAAEALASATDRVAFLQDMTGYAWEIGMPGSYFADPTGLSPANSGTAEGFFAMAQYLYKSRPDILAITRIKTISVATTTDHGAHIFANIHPFVDDLRFLGGKTGHTDEALDTMLTIMQIDGHPIAIIVLHSYNRRALDTSLLIDRVTNILAGE